MLGRILGRRRARALGAVTLALPLAAASSAGASTYTVTSYGDGTGSCAANSPSTFVCSTLRAAANAASTGSTIELSAGTYQLTLGQLQMGAATIQGSGPGGPGGTTVEQTDGRDRVIEVKTGPATLVGLEVTGGRLTPTISSGCSTAPVAGGGILAEGALALADVLVADNQAVVPTASGGSAGGCAQGGGIAYTATSSGSVITDSTITGNSATGGGGGASGGGGGLGVGGGVYYGGAGSLLVQQSTVSQNSATGGLGGPAASGGAGDGGGISGASDVTIVGSTVAANTAVGGAEGSGGPMLPPGSAGGAGSGGGVYGQDGTDRIVNSTIFANHAQGGSGGTGGGAQGGGLLVRGSGAALDLQSATIVANASSLAAGNLEVGTGTSPPSIHDTIVAGGSPSNCALSAGAASESYNLEDDSTGQCGFSPANHDLVAADPQLPAALADNGGPTQTLAPATTSPVLNAGGLCSDPASGQPLTTDQRGQPRPNPCDIGAFQSQAPRSSGRPVLSGVAARGHFLSCTSGTWTGDGPFSFTYQWLRDGVLIPGAVGAGYLIRAIDAGHTLACRVIAAHYGATVATSALASVTPNPLIMLLRATVSATTVTLSLGCRGAPGQRCSGVLKLTVVERVRGRKVLALLPASHGQASRTATVGRRTYGIAARYGRTLRLGLNTTGLGLLRRFAHLPVTLTLTQTLPTGSRPIASRKLTVPPVPRKRRRA